MRFESTNKHLMILRLLLHMKITKNRSIYTPLAILLFGDKFYATQMIGVEIKTTQPVKLAN